MHFGRRVDRVFLLHIWACVPFTPVWVLTGGRHPSQLAGVRAVAVVCAAYLLARTFVVFRGRRPERWSAVWPFADATLVTAILAAIGDAEAPTALLYMLPIAYGTLKLRPGLAMAVVALAVAGQFLAGVLTGTWAAYLAAGNGMHVAFRHFFFLLLASVIFFLGREAQRLRARLALAEYRRELSAEMHDGLQHDLALLARRLDLAAAVAGRDPARAAAIAVEERSAARRAAEELRLLIRQLRPEPGDADFTGALRAWLAILSEGCDAELVLEASGGCDLPPPCRHAALRIVQEAVMNAVKHAGPRRIRVSLRTDDAEHTLTVEDDGAGFDPGAPRDGYGLATMRERASALGGRFEISARPEGGTRVRVTFPVAPPAAKGWLDGTDPGAAGG